MEDCDIFFADSGELGTLKSYLKDKAKELDSDITDIYTLLDTNNLGKSWVGESYDVFAERCKSYQSNLRALATVIYLYSSLVGTIEIDTIGLANKLKGIFSEEGGN